MTTTNKGTIRIDFGNNCQPIVIFKPINGEIWLHKNELPELFGVYIQSINNAIDAIYKAGGYRPEDTSEYHLYQSGNTIQYDKYRFNLPIIIALAFHLESWQAKLIREWFICMMLKGNSLINYPIPQDIQNFRMN